jgi:hypothetical protein
MTLRQAVFALCAVIFAVTALAGLISFGDAEVRKLAIASALLGCFSQFAGQGASKMEARLSVALAYIGFLLAMIAVVIL